jgi:hypothetical protein
MRPYRLSYRLRNFNGNHCGAVTVGPHNLVARPGASEWRNRRSPLRSPVGGNANLLGGLSCVAIG